MKCSLRLFLEIPVTPSNTVIAVAAAVAFTVVAAACAIIAIIFLR